MTHVVIAQFSEADALLEAARESQREGTNVLDAFTPFPVEGMAELLGATSTRLRVVMAIGGFSMAAVAFGLQYYSAVIDYPINSGGRPLNSWPTFMLVPFATGILAAAIFGFIALLSETGLPRLHHALFEIPDFERASQDRFLLALEAPEAKKEIAALRQRLIEAGAIEVMEVAA
ncbi:MAG TPA: DUF3341 domain-containing protein [Pseudolabrys sp.]|nr:DUF3341 domain-containing protein [Pseudolabrys sp.]